MTAGLATVCGSAVAAQNLTAEQAVDGYISNLLAKLDVIRPLYETDKKAYFEEMEKAISDFVDFHEVARGVMAKYSQGPRGATPEQLDRFAKVFRSSLVEFYGSAMANYGSVHYEIIANRQQSENPERATNVRMAILTDNGDRKELQYTMFLNEDRVWKLRNLYVEGVNLRRQYYSRFDNLMNRNNFDIDKVIDLWQTEG